MSGKSEREVTKEIRLQCCELLDLFRNNCGAFRMDSGAMIRYGVGNPGGSDLIGIERATGRFVAIECKREKGGRLSKDQERFLARVKRSGGIAIVATSPADVLAAIEEANQ